MYKKFSGKCEKEGYCTISVEYTDTSTNEGNEMSKIRFQCDYIDKNNPKCKRANCPIYQNAPSVIK